MAQPTLPSLPALALVFLACLSPPVRAQLPLSIEALLVQDHRLSATVIAGRSSHREPVLARGPAGAALAWREFTIDQSSVGLRYGVSPRLELNARYEHHSLQWTVDGGVAGRDSAERVVVGANWLALRGKAGSLLLDVRLDAAARALGSLDGWQAGAGGSLGATWYRPLDPVVLAVAARYREVRSRRTPLGTLQPAPATTVDASVNFALNRQVTLLGGVALVHQDEAGTPLPRASGGSLRTSLTTGLAYQPVAAATLFLRARLPVGASEGGGGITAELLYEF